MRLTEFTGEDELDSFLSKQEGGSILQSWVWGDILKSAGGESRRFGVKRGEEVVLAATAVKKRIAGPYSYWQISRGPVLADSLVDKADALDFFFSGLVKEDGRIMFIRFEPPFVPPDRLLGRSLLKTIDLEPAETLVLDLRRTEADLLSAMHYKTRYNIGLAEKKGVAVEVKELPSEDDIGQFLRLIKLTGERDRFRLHPGEHYRRLLKIGQGKIKLFLASYQGKRIAAGIFSFWRDQACYLHGASDNEFRSVMAPYLLQWTAIKEARSSGCLSYDFYGINADKWPGVTRFKKGFGGGVRVFPGAYDLVLSAPKYGLYKALRRLRRIIA